jgi:hypothetical protein
MANKHSEIEQQVMLYWTQTEKGRLFKNPIGIATIGKHTIRYGLKPGSSDLIGCEMVDNLPVFCSIEVKTLDYPKVSKKQQRWLNWVDAINGQAYIVREYEDTFKLFRWIEGKEIEVKK